MKLLPTSSYRRTGSGRARPAAEFARPPASLIFLVVMLCVHSRAAGETNAPPPVTARDFYNVGTKLLGARKFAEAETMFRSALATQDERVQPPALYNLGETRFADGVATLKKGPEAKSVLSRGQAAASVSGQVLQQGRSAMAANDLEKMINSYLAGRGVRREVRAAEKAVQQALETYGTTLRKWQRAADDFQSAADLNPADQNAADNAALVRQHIARLVDSIREMQQMAGQLAGQRQQLGQMLSQLKGKIPAPNAPPGGGGEEDDEDDDGIKPDSLAGQKENPSQSGERMEQPLSPDVAGQLLDGLGLNGARRLSMADTNTSQPKDKTRRIW